MREFLYGPRKSEFGDSLVKVLFLERIVLGEKNRTSRFLRFDFFSNAARLASDRPTAPLHKPARTSLRVRHAVRDCEQDMTMPILPTDETLRVSSNENSDRGTVHPANRLAYSLRPIVAGAARFLRREPLAHFVLLGALIFGADAVLHPPPPMPKWRR
jgi:hypothetical protein